MNISISGSNVIRIEGSLNSMVDAETVKKSLDPLFETNANDITLHIIDSEVLASYLLGYLLNKRLEGHTIRIQAGRPRLLEMLEALNIDKALNASLDQ